MNCALCGYGGTNRLSGEHVFCPQCKGHEYKGVELTASEWAEWIEGGQAPDFGGDQ